MKALLVDDSKAARFAMGKLLKDQGLEVEMAASGEEALDKIATEPINIVFMDQSMPGMGGIAATRAITSNEKTAHIPVVLCTGNEGEKLEQMAAEAGAVGVLTKPPREEALKEVLSNVGEEVAEGIEELEKSVAEAAGVDMEAVMSEVNQLLEQVRQQIRDVEQALQQQVGEVAQAAEKGIQPLRSAFDGLDRRIGEKIKEQMSVDASNQRIQLEALRQQVNSGLDEMEEREERLRDSILQEVQKEVLTLVDRKLAPLKETVEEAAEESRNKAAALEKKMAGMEKGLLGKAALIAILASAAAFGAAFFVLGQ